ncbi:hypothetical protein, partial [Streptomyces sp. XY511]|uniref:hypothetical protein n=1 Tax=Streptomyces sp. XY511 TaxID=1519480 RepID=UPI001F194753
MYTRSWGATGGPAPGLVAVGLVVLVVLVLVAVGRPKASAVPPTVLGRWVGAGVGDADSDTQSGHDETGTDAERPHRAQF